MAAVTQGIENIIRSTASYSKIISEDDARNYEDCLHGEELQHADWIEKIKVSSAENYQAGFMAGANCSGKDDTLKNAGDVRVRLFDTIPAPCKAMNTNSFQRWVVHRTIVWEDFHQMQLCYSLKPHMSQTIRGFIIQALIYILFISCHLNLFSLSFGIILSERSVFVFKYRSNFTILC